MNNFFENKKILVTGIGHGIGKVIVGKLISRKAYVIAASKDTESLDLLKELFGNAVGVLQIDLDNPEDIFEKLKSIGIIHGLVNNVEIVEKKKSLDAIQNSSFSVNVDAIMNLISIVTSSMITNNIHGSVVNLTSQNNIMALKKCSVKKLIEEDLNAITASISKRLRSYRIRINSINPTITFFKTPTFSHIDDIKTKSVFVETPSGRFCNLDKVVNAILFLLSDDSNDINGMFLPLDRIESCKSLDLLSF